jgi:hypothetical protein
MPRHIFSPWDPLVRTDGKKEVVRDVSTLIVTRTDGRTLATSVMQTI